MRAMLEVNFRKKKTGLGACRGSKKRGNSSGSGGPAGAGFGRGPS